MTDHQDPYYNPFRCTACDRRDCFNDGWYHEVDQALKKRHAEMREHDKSRAEFEEACTELEDAKEKHNA